MNASQPSNRHCGAHINRGWSTTVRVLLSLALASVCFLGARTAVASTATVLTLNEAIGPASTDYIVRGLAQAQEQGASLVVLELNTPGGLDTAMRDIVQAILASSVPVATYVHPQGARAASAGTFLLYASHIAAMAPATTLGAATPVAIGLPGTPSPGATNPEDEPTGQPGEGKGSTPDAQGKPPSPSTGDAMTTKQVNDAAAFIRGLAQRHGRNAEWAERAVREAATLTAAEALHEKVVDVVAISTADLLRQIDGKTVHMATGDLLLSTQGMEAQALPPDARHRLLATIANPSLALIMLMIGIYGLLIEFSSPGIGAAGIMGGISLLLALFALQMLPVNYAGLGLIVLGMLLLGAELMSPSFGVLGIGGVAAFVAGGVLLFDRDVPGMGVPLPLIFGLAASSAAVVFLGGGMALRARRAPVVSGREELMGATGRVFEVTATEAWAQVHGESWAVRCDTPLQTGQTVRVKAIQGLLLHVIPMVDSINTKGETQ